MKVGMIGLGGMGKPVAECVTRAGFELTVTDLRKSQVDALVDAGATAAATPAEVAAASDLVLASLPSNQASLDVALGVDGVLAGAKQGDIYIDSSTIGPEIIRQVADAADQKGVSVLDAPVSGGIAQRNQGTLTVMVGGDPEAVERARPVLETFGGTIFHVGPLGAGATIKLINNLTMAANAVATMEALVLGVKAGLAPETIRDVVCASSGSSRMFDNLVDLILNQPARPAPGEGPRQGLHTVSKDVRLASDLAKSLSVPLILGSAATQAWIAGDAKGLAHHEIWALIEVFEELAGVELPKPG